MLGMTTNMSAPVQVYLPHWAWRGAGSACGSTRMETHPVKAAPREDGKRENVRPWNSHCVVVLALSLFFYKYSEYNNTADCSTNYIKIIYISSNGVAEFGRLLEDLIVSFTLDSLRV